MKRKSMTRAFILLSQKPCLLLLLLPAQALRPLISKLIMPQETNMLALSTPDGILKFLVTLLVGLGLMLLLLLLSDFFLVPPAMEQLRDGAAETATQPRWYSRGLKKHWWKPFTVDAMKEAIAMAVGFFAYMVLIVVMIAVLIPVSMASVSPGGMSSPFQGGTVVIILLLLVFVLFLVLVLLLIDAYCTMLLPALADRSFGRAFKAVFSVRGFLKVLKLIGIELIIGVLSLLIIAAFAAVYILLSGIPSSMEATSNAILRFEGSWTFFFVMLITSALALYKYAYSFCLFQEIRDEENAAVAPAPSIPEKSEIIATPTEPVLPENMDADTAQHSGEEQLP